MSNISNADAILAFVYEFNCKEDQIAKVHPDGKKLAAAIRTDRDPAGKKGTKL